MKFFHDHPRRILDVLSLCFIEIDRADLLLKYLRKGICIVLNGTIPLKKTLRNLIDMDICRLRREHGGHEELKRGLKIKGNYGIRIFPLQPAKDLQNLFIILHAIWNNTVPAKNQTGLACNASIDGATDAVLE